MLKAIESELYRISISDYYDNSSDTALVITVKDTNEDILVFSNELDELINLLKKASELF